MRFYAESFHRHSANIGGINFYFFHRKLQSMIVIIEDLGVPKEKVEEKFSELGKSFEYYQTSPENESELIERCEGAEVVTLVSQEMNAAVIKQLDDLKMISVSFTGFDHVDTEAARKNNVTVCNVPEYATESVAELVFGFCIGLLREFRRCEKLVREDEKYDFQKPGIKGRTLEGKTLGIIGTGRIGERVADMAKAFNTNVVAYDLKKSLENIEYVSLNELLEKSDIVTVHVPLTDATKGMLDREKIGRMKENSVLINAARAPIIEKEAIIEGIREGKLKMGLDVPPKDLPEDVRRSDNIIFTPHIGFYAEESLENKLDVTVENIRKFLQGKPKNVVS